MDDHRIFLLSSTNEALKSKILGTHAPDVEKMDLKPVLSVVEDILNRAKPSSADNYINVGYQIPLHSDTFDDDQVQETLKKLENPINYASYVISWKCGAGVDSKTLTMELLESLSQYSWDAKVVITCAAFAINYGEFWLLHQLRRPKKQLANCIGTLMGFPDATALAVGGVFEMELKALLEVLTTTLGLTHCIVEFHEVLSIDDVSRQSRPELLPIAVYWTMRSLVICASRLTNLSDRYIAKTSPETRETLQSLARNLSAMLGPLQKQLGSFRQKVEEEKRYSMLQRRKESNTGDIIEVLNALIRSKEDQMPLYNGAKMRKEKLEAMRKKYVLLLVSDLDFPPEQLHVLRWIHNEHSKISDLPYEILWLPIVDSIATGMTLRQETTFYNLRNNMPWFSVKHPTLVEPVAIRYIREDLHFAHEPMLVALDPQWRISNHDALPMIQIWGSKAFPYTKDWERRLWEESEWNIALIADNIDPRVPDWIITNKVICLYGGDNVDWIRKFTHSAQAAAMALNVPMEMLYVGKHNPKKKVRICHEVITRENLSNIAATEYCDYVCYFWVRITSIWNSKKRIGRTVDDDLIMKGILDLLTFDSSERGWAVFSRGNYEITMADGDKVLPVLDRHTEWGYEVDRPDKFVPVLDKHLRDCHPMDKCFMYCSCTD